MAIGLIFYYIPWLAADSKYSVFGLLNFIPHRFINGPSDSTVSEDARIKQELALTVLFANH
jgi:hypothetical protein